MVRRIKERKLLIFAAAFLAFTFCVYAPMEMYLANQDEFWFSLADMWWIPVLTGIIVFICITILGCFLKGGVLRIYETLVFGGGIALYLQGNFLSLNIGVQNGAKIYWSQYHQRFMINLFLWVGIIGIPVLFSLWKKGKAERVFLWISAFLTATQAVALVIMMIPAIISPIKKEMGFFSDKGCYSLGKDKNIIVFLLDMFDDSYFKEILEKEPDIAERLEGFTYFSNSVGKYSTTKYSLLKLMTGRSFKNEQEWPVWLEETAQNRLYMDELMDAGYEIGIYTDESAVPARMKKKAINYSYETMKINNYAGLGKALYKFVTNKYFPDIFKPKWWMFGTEFDEFKEAEGEYDIWNYDNNAFYAKMKGRGIAVEGAGKQYKFIHINGVHFPYLNNERAEKVEADSVSALQCARGALEIVMDYMDRMKSLGVYDNTAIIIMADHGYYNTGVLTNPVLAVKPAESYRKMEVSNAPVCHDDFQATILELAGLNKDGYYGKSVFEINEGELRDRFFYQYNLMEKEHENWRMIEYRIDPTDNGYEHFHLTNVEYTWDGRKIDHASYCKTCQGETNETQQYDPPRVIHEKSDDYPE